MNLRPIVFLMLAMPIAAQPMGGETECPKPNGACEAPAGTLVTLKKDLTNDQRCSARGAWRTDPPRGDKQPIITSNGCRGIFQWSATKDQPLVPPASPGLRPGQAR